jgi:anti-anti-sigma factor
MTTVSADITGAGTKVLTLDGEFDTSNSGNVEDAIHAALEGAGADVVVDLRGVRFLESKMVAALVGGLHQAEAQSSSFVLVRPNPRVWRVFVITGFSNRFRNFASLNDALAGIPPRSP